MKTDMFDKKRMLLAIGQRLGKKLGMLVGLSISLTVTTTGLTHFWGLMQLHCKQKKPINSRKTQNFCEFFFVLELKSLKLPHFGNFLGTFHVLFHFLISGTQF